MSKDREKSLREKLKQFLKMGGQRKGQETSSVGAYDSRKYVYSLTPQTIKDLSSQSTLSVRLKTLKELSEVVSCHRLEENAVEKLWIETLDLLTPDQPMDVRHQTMDFISSLIKGQLESMRIMAAIIFKFIINHNVIEDNTHRLMMLINLSENGKKITNFEHEIGHFMLKWMPDMITVGKTSQFLSLLINLIKFNAAYLDEEEISGFVLNTCILSSRTTSEEDIKLSLNVLDAIICYSYLPSASLMYFIEALCRAVNLDKLTESSLKLMRKFLGTHSGHSGIVAMCKILQGKQYSLDFRLLRGAVFFIGMHLWGCNKINSLKHSPSVVLPSFLCALKTKNPIVSREILLSVDRLVRKYGSDLQLLTWELLFDILECEISFQNDSSQLTTTTQLHSTISAIEDLHEAEMYSGSVDRLYVIIESVSSLRPENSVVKLIQYKSQMLYPTEHGWIENLICLMEKYFKNETRNSIRIKTLDVLSSVLCAIRHLYENELIDRVINVYFAHLNLDPDESVRNVAVQLIVDLAMVCVSSKCSDLLEIIKRVVSQPFVSMESSDYVHINVNDLLDVKTGIKGLIEISQRKIHSLPSTFAVTAHKYVISHIVSQYENLTTFENLSSIRFMIMKYLLSIRANSLKQIGIKTIDGGVSRVDFSSYLLCATTNQCLNTDCSSNKPLPFICNTYLSLKPVLDVIMSCLMKETDWPILELCLREIPLILQNKTFVLSSEGAVEKLCNCLCDMICKPRPGLPDKLRNFPAEFKISDFHSFVFPTLTALSSYNKYLSHQKQNTLISCLKFGLMSRCVGICINALTDCTLEMQLIMYKLLPNVLLDLSKISATARIASSILEFLSTLIMLPSLYASFVEDQYMSIFAIALPYTNPFKFQHYIVSLAHHVIAIWFLKCRLPYRRNFVKYIAKGLNVYITKPSEENSEIIRHRSSSLNESQSQPISHQLSTKRSSLHPNNKAFTDLSSQLPIDEAMMSFHKELTETCLDFLARYAFSTCSALPKRTPLADFLLKGGQTAAWLIGTSVITITTSGCGSKVLRKGLCQECYQLCRKESDSITDSLEESTSSQKINENQTSKLRRRHQSAAVTSLNSESKLVFPLIGSGTKDDSDVKDNLSYSRSRKDTISSIESTVSSETGHSHTMEEPETQSIDKLLFGSDASDRNESSEKKNRQRSLCSCWCQGWAEIQIRRPTGNTSWMMRIQNQPHLAVNSPTDFPFADIASLFLPSKMDSQIESSFEKYDVSGHKRINSESLCENEYQAIYKEQFDAVSSAKICLQTTENDRKKETVNDDDDWKNNDDQIRPEKECELEAKIQENLENTEEIDPDFTIKTVDEKNDNSSDVPPVTRSPIKMDSIETIEEENNGCSSSSYNTLSPTSSTKKKNTSGPNFRKTLSPPSSPQCQKPRENSSFQPYRSRVHTISVMTPVVSKSQSPRSSNSLKREIYKTGINPSFVFLQLFHNGFFGPKFERPLSIPKDTTMDRALKCLDLLQPFETHKIGVLYVDKDETDDEIKILSNQYGSVRYINFISGIGTLIRLEDADPKNTYLGGLYSGEDGKFTYIWQDDIMQVVFHIATMMPTTSDPHCSNKKRHIGNNDVTIVYNDSASDFKIDTFKGQFMYAYVIIEPVDHQSNIVTLKVKPEIQSFVEYRDPKIVSDHNLAIVVRQLALHASLAATIYKSQKVTAKNPFASNWLERLRSIKKLREKIFDYNAENNRNEDIPDSSLSKPNPTSMDFTDYV